MPDLSEVFESVQDSEPDKTAKVLDLSAKTGVHPETVHENLPTFERAAAAPSREDFKTIALHHPVVGNFLSDPLKMAVAHDDVHNLVAHSHANKELERAHGIAEAIAVGIQNSIPGMTLRNKMPDIALGDDASFAEKFAGNAAQFAADFPFMALGGAVGGAAAGPWGAAAGGFALPDAYRVALRQHMESGDESSAIDFAKQFFTLNSMKAGLKGAATGVLTFGAGRYARLATGGKLMILKDGSKMVVGGSGLAAGAAEVGTMTAAGSAAEGKMPESADIASNALLMGLMHGGGVLGEHVLDRTFPQRVADTVRVDATKDAAALLDEASKASKLRTRDPQGFKELMDKGKPVMIPVEAYETYFQAKGMDPEQVSKDLGVSESHEIAKKTGGDVVIPQGSYLSKEMDTHRSGLIEDIKFSQDHLTGNQLKEVQEQSKENAKAQAEFVKQQGELAEKVTKADTFMKQVHEQIMADVREKLQTKVPVDMLLKDKEKWLNANAKIVANHYVAEASRRNVDPTQLYATEFPRITAGGASSPGGISQEPGSLGGIEPSAGGRTPEGEVSSPGQASSSGRLGGSSSISIDPAIEDVKARADDWLGKEAAGRGMVHDDKFRLQFGTHVHDAINAHYKKINADFQAVPPEGKQAFVNGMEKHPSVMAQRLLREKLSSIQEAYPETAAAIPHDDAAASARILEGFKEHPADTLQQAPANAPTFYSKMQKDIETRLPEKATAEQVQALLRDAKEDERKWSGIDEFLKGKSKIDKSELLEFLAGNQLEIKEEMLGEPPKPEPTKEIATAPGQQLQAATAMPDTGRAAFHRWAGGRGMTSAHLNALWDQSTQEHMSLLVRMFADERPELVFTNAEPLPAEQTRQALIRRADTIVNERFDREVDRRMDEWSESYDGGGHYAAEVEKEDDRGPSDLTDEELRAAGAPQADNRPKKKIDVKLANGNAGGGKVKGYKTHVPGVAITPSSDVEGRYSVTHIGSGKNFGNFSKELPLEQAWHVVDEVGKLGIDFSLKDEKSFIGVGDNNKRIQEAVKTGHDAYLSKWDMPEFPTKKAWEVRYNGHSIGSDYFDSEEEAQAEADSHNDNERDEHYASARREIENDINRDDIVQDVYDELGIDGEGNDQDTGRARNEPEKPARAKTRYGESYALKGKEPESDRELMFVLPKLEAFEPNDRTHFADITGGKEIAWTRFATHKDDKGNNVLVLNEVQSKRHQTGREKGYRSSEAEAEYERRFSEYEKARDEHRPKIEAARAAENNAYAAELKAYSDAVMRLSPEDHQKLDAVPAYDDHERGADERRRFISSVDPEYADVLRKYREAEAENQAVEAALPQRPEGQAHGSVPDAPFKKTWHEFVMKRMIRYAAENGFDKLAWTTGEQQADFYNLAHQVDKITYDPKTETFKAFRNGSESVNTTVKPEGLAEIIGREAAEKLLAQPLGKKYEPKIEIRNEPHPAHEQYPYRLMLDGQEYNRLSTENSAQGEADDLRQRIAEGTESSVASEISEQSAHVLEGQELKIGGDGMKGFYDKMIPSFVNKFTKKWGGRVGESMVKTGDHESHYKVIDERGNIVHEAVTQHGAEVWKAARTNPEAFGIVNETAKRFEKVHSVEITPELKRAALQEGFPLFQGAQGEYVPQINEIRLHKTADASTFMHEFSHGALQHMFDFVKSGQATKEYLDHFDAVKDFLKIGDDQEKLTTEQHEKFARGWERYLRGEDTQGGATMAPTKELQGAFDMFRRWMTNVYRKIKGSPIEAELTPDVRRFFERMLASEDEIVRAAQEAGYKDAEIASIPDADPAQQERHRTLQERARTQAENALIKDQMDELREQNKLALDKERERAVKRLEPEVAELPLYRAMSDVEENRPGARRSAANLADDFLAGKLGDQEQGAFEAAAEVYGFSDGTDLAQSIKADVEAGGQASTLKRRVDEAMKPYADLKDTEAIREAALKAVHEHQMTELLAMEQNILSSMQHDQEVRSEVAKRNRVSASMAAATAKQNAKDYLESRPLREAASFRSFITAERNAAVRVSKAIAAGDFEAAAEAKGQQMLNHALAAEAMKNKAEINRKGKFLDKFIKRGQDMMNMPYGFITKIDDMLVSHGLMDPRDPALQDTLAKNAQAMSEKGSDPSEIANATGLVRGSDGNWTRETLPQLVARVNDLNYPINLPDSVMSGQEGGLKQRNPNMTLAELRDLHQAVKTVSWIGGTFDKFLSAFMKGDIRTNAAALKAQIEKNIGTPYGNGPVLGDLDMNKLEKAIAGIKAQPDGMIASKVNLLTLCEFLDRLDPDGPAKNNIYRPLREAENKERAMTKDYTERLNAIREKHYTKDEISKMGDESFSKWQIDTPEGKKNVRLTKENALVLLLNRGSESNLDRIVRGFGIDAERIKAITDGLDKRDHEFAQDIWNYVNTLWPEASALEMRVNGVEPVKVKAIPVESVHGTFQGGYYPLAYDFTKSADAYKNAEQRNALFKQYSSAAAHTEQGAMQQRVQTLSRPVRLTFDGLFGHLQDVIHDISYREPVIDVARFLNQPDAKNSIVNSVGIDGYKKIGDDLKSAASSQVDFMTPAEKRMRWFRFSTSFATLGYRIAIFPRRLTEDAMNAMREVGFTNSVGATADYVMNPTETRDFVQENVPVMRERGITRERDLMEMSRQWKGRESKIKMFAFLQDTIADQAMSYPVASAVYKANLAKYGPERAGQIAGESIIKTFGSGSQIDRVGAQRGSELNQLQSMYYSWHSMMFNRAWLQGKIAGLEYNEGNYGKALAIIAATTATTWVIPAATDIFWHEVLHNAPQGQETDEERDKRRLGKFLEAPFAYFPMARNVAAFAIPKMLGEHGRDYKMSPAEDAIETLAKTAADTTHTMFDPNKQFEKKDAEQAARSASILLGTPNQLNTWVFNFKDYLDGEGELTWRDIVSKRSKK